jgi:hypothetical protein
MQGMNSYTQAAMERAMKVQEVMLQAAYSGTISGIEVGDVTLTAMGDGTGDVLSIIIDDHDANGNVLPAGSLYITGMSIAGVCGSGYSFYDRPFSKKRLDSNSNSHNAPPSPSVKGTSSSSISKRRLKIVNNYHAGNDSDSPVVVGSRPSLTVDYDSVRFLYARVPFSA